MYIILASAVEMCHSNDLVEAHNYGAEKFSVDQCCAFVQLKKDCCPVLYQTSDYVQQSTQ